MTPLNELTREKILAMEAGREMDAYVHEVRTGVSLGCLHGSVTHPSPSSNLKICNECGERFGDYTYAAARSGWDFYSSFLPHAWALREPMKPLDRNLHMVAYTYNRVYAQFAKGDPVEDGWAEANGEHAAPLAICRAFLLATLEERG